VPELRALRSAGRDVTTEQCAKNSNPAHGQNLQPHKHHPALTFAVQTWLNMTSTIPVDKPLKIPGSVPRFCELRHLIWVIFGKEVQPATPRVPLYQNSFIAFRIGEITRVVVLNGDARYCGGVGRSRSNAGFTPA